MAKLAVFPINCNSEYPKMAGMHKCTNTSLGQCRIEFCMEFPPSRGLQSGSGLDLVLQQVGNLALV